jgi:hypothetical protein
MDNGLIFPYPLWFANAESRSAKSRELMKPSGGVGEPLDPCW